MGGINIVFFISVVMVITTKCAGLTFINPGGPVPPRCMDCICDTVSDCTEEEVCTEGDACGPYRITPSFWLDSGRPTINGDEPDSEDAFVNCAINKRCSSRSVQQYMEKNRMDCNGDGIIDCKDYFILHLHGAAACIKPLHENFHDRFLKCDQPLKRVPAVVNESSLFLPNLDDKCIQCLCDAASGCDKTIECDTGYCGAFQISKIYWLDAGSPVLPGDDPERRTAFEDCVTNDECAVKTVKQYFKKYAKDCNGDQVTTCFDYMMINFNGGYGCEDPLDRNDWGMEWLENYQKCMIDEEQISIS